uniref:Uncharacterized protein n=1 Tax=Sphaerodactylus townsendi TaxID=933632 RepID=A0ACB8F1L0_9SAUR
MKQLGPFSLRSVGNPESDGERSDYNLVVDEDPPSEHDIPACASAAKRLPGQRDVPDSPASLASTRSATPLRVKDSNVMWET